MKHLILLWTLLACGGALAQDSIFRPFREGQSNYVSQKKAERALDKLSEIKDSLISDAEGVLAQYDEKLESTDLELFHAHLIVQLKPVLGKKLKFAEERRKYFLYALDLLRSEAVIDDTFYRMNQDFIAQKYPEEEELTPGPGLSLKDYIQKKKVLKKYFSDFSAHSDDVTEEAQNPFPFKHYKVKAKNYKNLSVRERLLYVYSAKQIKEMAMIMNLALKIADAKKMYTTIEFRDQSESIVLNHSPTEQYRLSVRLLRMKKKEAENDGSKIGMSVEDMDLIGSAYELGVLSYDEISLIAHNKDFYVPKKSLALKVGKYLADLGLLALRVNPATAGYAIVPMMMYNSFMQSKKASETVDEDSFFFTVPERKQ
jgi:hypothetical protein